MVQCQIWAVRKSRPWSVGPSARSCNLTNAALRWKRRCACQFIWILILCACSRTLPHGVTSPALHAVAGIQGDLPRDAPDVANQRPDADGIVVALVRLRIELID